MRKRVCVELIHDNGQYKRGPVIDRRLIKKLTRKKYIITLTGHIILAYGIPGINTGGIAIEGCIFGAGYSRFLMLRNKKQYKEYVSIITRYKLML